MERLMMEFTVGDQYTYSAEVTFPIVYESKEKALHDFELLLIEKIDSLFTLQKERTKIDDERYDLLQTLQKISPNKMTPKEKEKYNITFGEKLQKLRHDKESPLELKIKETETILFGGQSFTLDQFVYLRESDKQSDYCLPTIQTLDEYFSPVENTLVQSKKIKP